MPRNLSRSGKASKKSDFHPDLPSPHLLNRHYLSDRRFSLSSSTRDHKSSSKPLLRSRVIVSWSFDAGSDVDRMDKSQVIIPIALPVLRDRNVKGPGLDATKAIELSFVSGKPCVLATWGFTPQLEDIPSPPQDQQMAPLRGAFIGCEDGSVYLFHPKLGVKSDLISPAQFNFELTDTPLHTRPSTSSGVSHLGRNPSAFSSQSSLKSTSNPFHLSRSKIVSGVTAEAVEAPRNYVDFEEEPEKLKSLLKHKGPVKDRNIMDAVFPSFEKNISFDKYPVPPLPTTTTATGMQPRKPPKKNSESRVCSSHSRTPSHPNNSTSTQASPTATLPHLHTSGDIYSLYLHSHTFTSRFGPDNAISQLLADEPQRCVICLQKNGYIHQSCILDTVLTTWIRDISILSTTDGSCHVSARPDSSVLVPPSGAADHRTLHYAWTWKWVHLVKTQDVSTTPAPLSKSPP